MTKVKQKDRNARPAVNRRYPIGAELSPNGETRFRVWAPKAKRVEVVLESGSYNLNAEPGGYFSGAARSDPDALYRFRLDQGEQLYPDPASRFQPEGPQGPSCVVDPFAFDWSDAKWAGVRLPGQVIYELHVGTFTMEGTYRAAAAQLHELARIGITVIELMPLADFAGKFGWGYDGVNLFAPTRLYGSPDDLRSFVNDAHAAGIAVILDVVYNHFGPEGNYLGSFSDDYVTDRYTNDWGQSLNFDGPNSCPVREYFVSNARYWIDEFHFDGFRFDATQDICDRSPEYIIGAIGRAARAAAGERPLILVAENEPQETRLVRPESDGGDDLDGLWNDDFHHSAIVALTGRNEAYFTDYAGAPQEFISTAKRGYLFQGQHYTWQSKGRGTSTAGLPPEAFVAFIENHDQVANGASGERVRVQTSPGKYRAMTALLLMGPWTPMLFQGQEFGATTPFIFFSDMSADLRDAIQKGRFEFLMQFPSAATEEAQERLPAPANPETFTRCKLNFAERATNQHLYDLHIDLLRLRHDDARFRQQPIGAVDGAVLTDSSFVLRFFGSDAETRLLIVNFGQRIELPIIPEPLLAPPTAHGWDTLWSSDSPRYGGPGAVPLAAGREWVLSSESAVVLHPVRKRKPRRVRKP